jgi:hypothetical protein
MIVGAGPTGLVWRTAARIARAHHRHHGRGRDDLACLSRAVAYSNYRQIGLADEVVERGWKVLAANIWVTGKHVARAVFVDGQGLSPFPYLDLSTGYERLLIDRLAKAGVGIELMELIDFDDTAGRVCAHLKRAMER